MHHNIQCIRALGSRGMVEHTVVPTPVLQVNRRIANCSNGTPSHSARLCCLGSSLVKHRVIQQGNNQAVVACLLSRYSREPTPMHLLRNLVYIEAMYGFYLSPENIDMYTNRIADDLSRNHILTFSSKVQTASPYQTSVSPLLVDLLNP